jgi:hypothetical protein
MDNRQSHFGWRGEIWLQAGTRYGHPGHSAVMALRTPVYRSAPREM